MFIIWILGAVGAALALQFRANSAGPTAYNMPPTRRPSRILLDTDMPEGEHGKGAFRDTTTSRFWLRRVSDHIGRPMLEEFHALQGRAYRDDSPRDFGQWIPLIDNRQPMNEPRAFRASLYHYWLRPGAYGTEMYNSATDRWSPAVQGASTPR